MATIEQLQASLKALEQTISELTIKAETLQRQLGSGEDFGMVKFANLRAELERVNTAMLKLQETRASLTARLNEQVSTRQKPSDAYDKLAQSIENARAKLAKLQEAANKPYASFRDVERVRNQEAQIRRMESQLRREEPQRYRNIGAAVGETILSGGQAEGVDKGQKETEKVVQSELDNWERLWRQAAIEAEQAAGKIMADQAAAVGTPIGGGATKTRATEAAPKEAEKQIEGLDIVNAKIRPSVDRAISALQASGKAVESIADLKEVASGVTRVKGQLRSKTFDAKGQEILSLPQNYQFFVDSMGNYASTLQKLRVQQFRKSANAQKLFDEAAKVGFTPEDLKRVSAEGRGAYRVARMQRTDEFGTSQQQDYRIDQRGNVSTAPVRRQFQSFGQSVVRDIVELTKWSLAISAIYGPINALSGAIQELIANQSKLADVSIAVNESIANTDKVFGTVYSAAQRAGEGVSGVIDAFGQAYRAAGRVTDESERYAASVKLLDASLVLSKISTLDQAQAIDTLTAALYQAGGSEESAADKFDKATTILDEWVAVSKAANVDVATLATGMAVLGDSAEAAGLSLEELNALIGTIAEVSIAGGKEAANIAKAIVGNYTQPEAERSLSRFGIAIKDVTGQNRQFLDVMKDIASLRQAGGIGDQDFARIAQALGGGGVRRGAEVAKFLENIGRMEQLVAVQGDSAGASQQALAKQLDTVQTSVTRLGNALTGLVQALGSQGGLLDVFASAINLASKLVEILTNLAQVLGKTGPILLGLATAAIALKATGTSWGDILIRKVAPNVAGIGLGKGPADIATRQEREAGVFGTLTGQNRLGRIGGSILAAGLPALQNFAQGDTAEAWANIAGGALGALLGGPIGALAGAAIAEAFVRGTLTYDTAFTNFFADSMKGATKEAAPEKTIEDTKKALTAEAFKEAGVGSEGLGKFVGKILQTIGRQNQAGGIDFFRGGGPTEKFTTPESAIFAVIKERYPDLYRRIVAARGATGEAVPGVETALTREQTRLTTPELKTQLSQLQKARQEELRGGLLTGEIKPAEYAKQMQYLTAYTTTAVRYMAALGDQVKLLGGGFNDAGGAYQDFLDIMSTGNEEVIDQINQQIASIQSLQNILETWNPAEPDRQFLNPLTGQEQVGTKQEVQDIIKMLQEGLAHTIEFGAGQARLQQIQGNLPNIFGSQITPSRPEDVATLIEKTREAQKIKYQELKPEDYQALIDSFDKVAILVEEGGKIILKTFEGIDSAVLGEMQKFLEESGQIQPLGQADQGTSNFQQIDVTLAQLMQAVQQANAMALSLQQNYGYQPNFEDVIFATSDEQISKQHVDMKILQYILGQILETEKKQLEGMYNIPEGATFWVPLTAAWLAPRKNEGGIGSDLESMIAELLAKQQETPAITSPAKLPEQPPYERPLDYATGTPEKLTSPTPDRLQEIRDMYGTGTPRISADDAKLSLFQQAIQTFITNFGNLKDKQEPSTFDQLIESLREIGPAIQSFFENLGNQGAQGKMGAGLGSIARSPLDQAGAPAASAPTKFNISFASTTQLVVDGRVLASIIKPYLTEDMVNTNETGGTITRQYVI